MQTEQLIKEAVVRFGKESATYYLDLPTIHFFKQFLVRELSTIASKSAEVEEEKLCQFLKREFIHYLSDPECFHGMFFDECKNNQCETRAENHVVSKLFEALSQPKENNAK